MIRTRFAPSPTGQVHIGNIRTAIFNWLYARNASGSFLLRVEDTDLQRSTKEAIDTLLDCMKWLGLDYDGEPLYQSSQGESHLKAALGLVERGSAYRPDAPDGAPTPVIFRIPYACDSMPFIRETGAADIELEPGSAVCLGHRGASWLLKGPKGKPVEAASCLAGLKGLEVFGTSGASMFKLEADIASGAEDIKLEGCSKMRFTRREVFFKDMVKGELAKPLDSMKDFVIVRSDGSPVFHLANVCDDISQGVTHIVRGDDHVENSYRHLFLFAALGAEPPAYSHLPMIVNSSGKPYSKRDGDAFVGDFRKKGFLPQALFNYLALLGWSPGDDREKLSKDELVSLFSMERVKSSPAQFDMAKLSNMNGLYMAEMGQEEFSQAVWDFSARHPWRGKASRALFDKVAALMQSRTKTFADSSAWGYFFDDAFEYDMKAFKKLLSNEANRKAVAEVADWLDAELEAGLPSIEAAVKAVETSNAIQQGKLNQPLRVAITGATIGAGVYETIALLGAANSASRIRRALSLQSQN